MALLKKHLNKKNDSGHTMIELMIVLMIVTMITAMAVLSFRSLSDEKAIDHFLEQLEDDIYYAQILALSKGKTVSIHFRPETYRYDIYGSIGETFLVRKYAESIKITKGSTDYRIYFNANGNIRNPGTLIIETKKEKYVLTFQLGKGRFYVQKL